MRPRSTFHIRYSVLSVVFLLAILVFVYVQFTGIREQGIVGYLDHMAGNPRDGFGFFLMPLMFVIHVIGELVKPLSLAFRLYGNIFAGENMLESMANLVPGLGWLIPIPFYFLEVLVGLVQALVFMLLTAVFTLLICTHEEGHEKAHDSTERISVV